MSDKINFNEFPNVTKIRINDRTWKLAETFPSSMQLWTSYWWCDDGDAVDLYIKPDKAGFEVNCFSGLPSSHIIIDIIDFGLLWDKMTDEETYLPPIKPIKEYSYTHRCVMLADWLCHFFCKYSEPSNK